MIRFSNRVKYGIQFLLFLSVDDEGFTGIQRAAISCNISQKFLEAIAVDLKKGGILDVKRGAGGGYRLSRLPNEISLTQIVRVLEQGIDKPYVKDRELIASVVDGIIKESIEEFWKILEHVTIEDVKRRYLNSTEKIMYYI
ncbi:MAG: Rrf2 family transcriptional regulator [Marinilabiliaceae bacterium]|nr:Rrf2 family transcriptional regulator [Marinilabiliaceae bacterium]